MVIRVLSPASSVPEVGWTLTLPNPPPLYCTLACHWRDSGPRLTSRTSTDRLSPLQPRVTWVGETASQSPWNGVAVGLGVAVGRPVAVDCAAPCPPWLE